MCILAAVITQAWRRFFFPAFALIVLAFVPGSFAAQVTWTLHNVAFSDGGTVSGSFVYNADTNTYSSVDIVTTTGTSFSGATYINPFPSNAALAPTSTTLYAQTLSTVTVPTSSPWLYLFFSSPLTDGGTPVSLTAVGEGQCSPNCTASRTVSLTGTVTSNQPATITNPPTTSISTGTVVYPLSAAGGSGTYTWSLLSGSLPTGVALSALVPNSFQSNQQAGLLGVATSPGIYHFTLSLFAGVTHTTQEFTIFVTSLNIKDLNQLPDAFVGSAYSYSLTALNPANAGANVAFTLANGNNLPSGLSLSTAGVISGTPTAQGQSSFSITLTDGVNTTSRGFNLNVSAVQITTAGQLPNATQGAAYNQTLAVTGGSGTNTFSLTGNSLPSGLSLSSSGTISGTVSSGWAPGNQSFQVTVSNSGGNYQKWFSLDVLASPTPGLPEISVQRFDDLTVDDPASIVVATCCSGVAPFTWSATGLPTGMSVRSGSGVTSSSVAPGSAEIWGVPQAAGNYTIALTLTDNNGNSTTQNIPLHVSNLDELNFLPSGLVNTAYSAPIIVMGGTGPYSATLVGSSSPVNGALPDGIAIQSGAALSGTPLVNGTFTPIFRLSDSSSTANTLTRSNTLTIANVSGGITVYSPTASMGTFAMGQNYTTFFGAFGASTIVWSVAGGALPPGMTLSSSGEFTGKLTTAGTYSFLVKAADQAGLAAAGYAFTTITVTPISAALTVTLPFGNVGTAYSQMLTATGGTAPLTWTLNANNYLPPGLTLSTAGVIGGTPTSAGQYSFNVTVTDANGNIASQGINVSIYPAGGGPPIVVTSGSTFTLTTGTQQYPLGASGGNGTYAWSLTSGTLPPGLAIRTDTPGYFFSNQQAGLIGVATTPGTYNFTLTVTSGSQSVPQAFTVKITALNFQDLSNLPDDFASQPYSYTFTALNPANAGANVAFTVAANSSLPPGLSLSTAGVLSGTNGVPNNYSFQITLTDGVDTVTQSFNLLSSEVQIVSNAVLPNGTQGAAYNQTILSNGGTGPYTYQLSGGSLPPGLTLTNGGNISGTINSTAATGPYPFGMVTLDSVGDTYTLQMSIDVLAAGETLPGITVGEVDDLTIGDTSSFNIGPCCGGAAPFTWSATGLPTGMSARFGSGVTSSNVSAGNVEIWGVPQTAGSYTVTLTMTDHNGLVTSQTFPLNVSVLDEPDLSGGVVGVPLNDPIRVLGGTAPYTAELVGGSLPYGLTLNSGASSGSSEGEGAGFATNSGTTGPSISGTPAAPGTFDAAIQSTDELSHKIRKLKDLYVEAGCSSSILISNNGDSGLGGAVLVYIPFGGTGPAFGSFADGVVPGLGDWTWSIASGSLPPGLTLPATTGSSIPIEGEALAAGSYTFVLKATDPTGEHCPGYRVVTIVVSTLVMVTQVFGGTEGRTFDEFLGALVAQAPTGGGTTDSVSLSSGVQASATNDVTYTWSLNSGSYLPPGLTLSSAGALSGTPTSVGQYQFGVSVTDSGGDFGTGTITVNVYPAAGLPITITSPATSTITTGTQQIPLTSQGGDATFTWSLLSGSLPPGLAIRTDVPSSFNPTTQQAGLIGVATTPGTYNYTLQVSSASQTQSLAFTTKVTALNIQDLNTLPDSFVGSSYSYTFTALNAANAGADVSFSVSNGSTLPAGLSLSTAGVLSGTPTASGQYNFGVTLTDGTDTIQQNFNLNTYTVQITTAGLLPNGTQNAAYNQTLAAGGGTSPYTFHIQGGQLPNGLNLSSSGAITGTINSTAQPGTYTFNVTVTDSSNNSYGKQMALDVIGNPAVLPGISIPMMNDLTVGDSGALNFGTCCGGTAPFTWSATGLPTGMSARTGSGVTTSSVPAGFVELWGVPQATGNYTVQVTATDANGVATSQSFNLHVSPLDQTPMLPGGTLNTAYSQTLRVLGGTGPYTASLFSGKLPDGLTLDPDPSVTGTPIENGNFGPSVQFSDSASPANTLVRGEGLNIGNGGGIAINNNYNLGALQSGRFYSQQLNACCVAAYTFSVASGSLPSGLSLSSSGQLSGTPTGSGPFTVLIEAADQAAVANPGFEQFTGTVSSITVATASLPYGNVGTAYSQTLAATGGTGALTWALFTSDLLPPGLTLSSAGVISGTPTSRGTYQFSVTVVDANGNTGSASFTLSIYAAGGGPPLTIVTAATQTLTAGTVQYPLTASGANGTFTWSLTSGSLPPGVALRTDVPSNFGSNQQAGLIGVATTPGTYNFTLTAASGSQSTPQAFTVKITALNIKDLNQLPDAFVGSVYSYSFTALNPANSGANVSFAVSNGNSLPAGLSLSTAGVLSGTPTGSAGNYNFGITMTDGVDTVSRGFNLNVSAVQITTAGLLPNATQGVSYSQAIAATGGSGSYTFSVMGGLPNGFSLSSGGTLSGTTTNNSGTFRFQVQVRDSSNNSYNKSMALDVIGTTPQLPEVSVPFVGDGVVGDNVSFTVSPCCGGTAPFSWSVTGLPTGMSARTGAANTSSNVFPGDVEIWGVPQTVGSYTVQLTLTDANSNATTESFPFKVSALDQNPQLNSGVINTPYSQTLRVLGGSGAYSVTQVGGTLPDGIALSSLTVSGTPIENGGFGPVFRFTDSATPANVLVRSNGFNIANVANSLNINTPSNLGTVVVGTSYSNQLNACCVSAYTWTVAGGALPAGITLSTAGLLSGTPTASGTYLFLVKAADQAAVANPSYEQFTLVVTPIAITTNGLPFGNVGASYSQTLAATGGTGTLTWSLMPVAGNNASPNQYLPPGLTLSSAGVLSGTPTSAGQYNFTVTVTDANNNTNTRNFDMDVYVAGGGPPVNITTSTSATLVTGTQQYALGASGGTGTYAWSLTSGSLPPGLAIRTDVPGSFNSSQQAGLIGVATTPGTYNFTLTVTSGNQSTPQAFTIKITALNIKDLGQLPDSFVGSSYSYAFTALNPANAGANVSFTVSNGNPLPTGLTLSTAGVLSGTPTGSAGNYNFGVTLTDGVDTVSRGFNINLSAVQITTAGQLPNATQGVAYSKTISASGGSGGYSFSVLGGLPNGLSLSSGGTLSGTITSGGGVSSFQIQVRDSSNNSYAKNMTLDVVGAAPALPEISLGHVDDAVIGDVGSFTVSACCGGVAPFTWSVTGLPTGMSARTGAANTSSNVPPGFVEVWGIPQAGGSYTVQFTLTDANSNSTTQSFTFEVSILDQNPGLPGGALGTAYSQSLRVLGGAGPYAVTQVGGAFPDGITLNTNALTVGGTPLENGNFGPVLRFTDSASPAHVLVRTNGMNISNLAGTGININNNSNLGTTQLGSSYSQQLNACCVSAYTWTVAGGALPTGLSLSTAGLLGGTPTAAGTFTFLVKAADQAAVANPGYEQLTLTVTPISITTNSLPYGNLTAAYSQTLAATGGTGTLVWSLNANSFLPPGLTLSSAGVISGTPTSTGQYGFTVTVTDANNNTASRGYAISVYVAGGSPLGISTAATINFSTGTEQFPLTASGGNGTYAWSLTSGSLPPGISLRSDVPSSFSASQQAGLIGVATTPGTYHFTLTVTSGSQSVALAFTANITALNFMDSILPDAFAGVPYSYQLSAVGNAAAVTFTVGNCTGALSGMNLSSSGVLSGTPTPAGSYSCTIDLTDGISTIPHTFTFFVSPLQFTTPGQLPNGTQNASYNQTISVSGGSGGYTFSLNGGNIPTSSTSTGAAGGLPDGLTLSSAGVISGTINAQPGQYAFPVVATDSSSNSYTKLMSIDVIGAPPALPEIALGNIGNQFPIDATFGDAYSFATGTSYGGTAPFTWSATGLPAGMSVRSSSSASARYTIAPGAAEIWGVPQSAGAFTVTLTATDANGLATSLTFPFHVSVLDQKPLLPNGSFNTAYAAPLRILGGTGPYTASVVDLNPSLPYGLTYNSGTGQVSGTPLETGSFTPVFQIADSASDTLLRSNSFNIASPAGQNITIDTGSDLGVGIAALSTPLSPVQLSACCVASVNWSLAGGTLPTGLTLSTSGVVSGTPTVAGVYKFLIKAADAANVANPGYKQFRLTVTQIAVTPTGQLSNATVGTPYSVSLTATGATGSVSWSVPIFWYLPPGLTLSSNGTLSGTPTSAGQYTFVAIGEDTNSNMGGTQLTLNIYPPPATITNVTSATANGTYGAGTVIGVQVTFSRPVTVTGTPTLALNTVPVETASFVSGSGTSTLTFNYTVASGDSTAGAAPLDALSTAALTLNGGAILDVNSQAVTLTLPVPGGAGSLGANKNIVIAAVATGTTPQTITFGSLSNVTYGVSPFSIAASASANSGLTIAFASNTTSVCSVSGATVTILAGGPCSITASQPGNATYAAATPVAQGFTVNPAAQTITFGSLPAVGAGSAPFTLSATAGSGLTVTFSTTTTAVCTVSVNTVTIVAAGSCSIAADQAGNADYSAAPTVTQIFAVTNNLLTAGSAFAGPGSAYAIPTSVCSYTTQCFLVPGASFSIPVTLGLAGGATVNSLTFGVQITPNAAAPALTGALGFTKASAIADTPVVSAGGTANSVGILWSSFTTPLGGSTSLGFVTGTLPTNAIPGQTYTVTVTGASAALASASVPVGPGASGGIAVGYTYLVGDVAPKPSDTAPNFGDGVLNILDLIQELFAVNNISGFVPAACSDRLDAMDLFPADTTTTRGGDGILDIRDLILELFRVNNLDQNRPVRSSRGGCAASSSSSENSDASPASAHATAAVPKPEPAIEGALVLGPAESASPTEDRVPIYLEARQDLVNIAVTFALGDQLSQLRLVPTLQAPPSFANDSQLGVVAGAWLEGINLRAGNRLLLGYVAGPAAAMSNLKAYGLSAAGLNDNKEVRLAPPAGPASQ